MESNDGAYFKEMYDKEKVNNLKDKPAGTKDANVKAFLDKLCGSVIDRLESDQFIESFQLLFTVFACLTPNRQCNSIICIFINTIYHDSF